MLWGAVLGDPPGYRIEPPPVDDGDDENRVAGDAVNAVAMGMWQVDGCYGVSPGVSAKRRSMRSTPFFDTVNRGLLAGNVLGCPRLFPPNTGNARFEPVYAMFDIAKFIAHFGL